MLDFLIPIFGLMIILGVAAGGNTALRFLAVVLLLAYAVWALMLFAQGTTPGKKALDMYVVKENGQRAGFGTMLIREWIGKWISGFFFALGYLWILLDKERQGWHDKLMSTYVVLQ